jgi:NADPH:quinone reductase-like Zn-dependent oxidoreductase
LIPAAGLAVAHGTAHVALAHRCGVRAGSTVLVLGAGGGVGLAAVQVALARGARVAAVAAGAAKADALRAEGAHIVLDSLTLGKGGIKAALAAADPSFAPKGVDCVFDPVGGKALADAMKCLAARAAAARVHACIRIWPCCMRADAAAGALRARSGAATSRSSALRAATSRSCRPTCCWSRT